MMIFNLKKVRNMKIGRINRNVYYIFFFKVIVKSYYNISFLSFIWRGYL